MTGGKTGDPGLLDLLLQGIAPPVEGVEAVPDQKLPDDGELFRRLGQFGVTVYEQQFQALASAGGLSLLDEDTAILETKRFYDPDVGLSFGNRADSGSFI